MGRELRRVPLDFDWPINEIWPGFVNPYGKFRRECPACGGSGYAPEARRFKDQWYGESPFDPATYGATPLAPDHPAILAIAACNLEAAPDFYGVPPLGYEGAMSREVNRLFDLKLVQWSHHLIQADVDALVAADRLPDFTRVPRTEEQRQTVAAKVAAGGNSWLPESNGYRPAAAEVNDWSLRGMGHDWINQSTCVAARCEREGVAVYCPECRGNGSRWPGPEFEAMYDAWVPIPVPDGDGYQMWSTTSEGEPMSPVFATGEELARWLANTGASSCGRMTATYEQWLGMIRGPGWATDLVSDAKGVRSGVAAASERP